MRVSVIGSRTFNNFNILLNILDSVPIDSIVSGGAKGADSLAKRYADMSGLPITEYLPNWSKYGRRAGFVRNIDIVNDCDLVIAFWDGVSKGTGHSIDYARKIGKPLKIIIYDTN